MTFEQYSKLVEVEKLPIETDGDKTRREIARISAIRNIPVETLESLPFAELADYVRNTPNPVLEEDGEVQYAFIHKGRPYELVQSIDDMNLYQFTDCHKYITEGQYLAAFVVCTYNRETYIQSDRLIKSFSTRLEDLYDVDSQIWAPYMAELVKKKNQQIYSTIGSLSLDQIKEMERQTIKSILMLMDSQLSYLKQPEATFWQRVLSYTLTPLKGLISWAFTRLAPELIIKLLSKRL